MQDCGLDMSGWRSGLSRRASSALSSMDYERVKDLIITDMLHHEARIGDVTGREIFEWVIDKEGRWK